MWSKFSADARAAGSKMETRACYCTAFLFLSVATLCEQERRPVANVGLEQGKASLPSGYLNERSSLLSIRLPCMEPHRGIPYSRVTPVLGETLFVAPERVVCERNRNPSRTTTPTGLSSSVIILLVSSLNSLAGLRSPLQLHYKMVFVSSVASSRSISLSVAVLRCTERERRIFMELMTSVLKLMASREGSQ